MTGYSVAEQEFISKITAITKDNLQNDQFNSNELANLIALSRSNLYRKIKKITGLSISQFICKIRLKKALDLLQHSSLTVSETAFECGFQSVTYFSKCFHDYFGMSPGAARKMELNIISLKDKKQIENSVAVKPFEYLGDDSGKSYLATALMIEIVNQLSVIKDLTVMSPTSINPQSDESDQEIAERLNVHYLLDGKLQVHRNRIKLILNLADTNNGNLKWSDSFNTELENLIELQSEISKQVANNLNAVILPEERLLMDRKPTINLVAHDYYLRGSEELLKYKLNNYNNEAIQKAKTYFRKALENETRHPRIYTGLAEAYIYENRGHFYSESTLDSIYILANSALLCDNMSAGAYVLRGIYFGFKGNTIKALAEYNKALDITPNNWEAYRGKGLSTYMNNPIIGIDSLHKAVLLAHGLEKKILLSELIIVYMFVGFRDLALKFNNQILTEFDDHLMHYSLQGAIESQQGNYITAIEFYEKAHSINERFSIYMLFYQDILRQLAFNYLFAGRYSESLKFAKKWLKLLNDNTNLGYNFMHRVAYAFWKNGKKKEATQYFNLQIELCNSMIETNHFWSQNYLSYYDRASVYAFRKQKVQAIKDLKMLQHLSKPPLWLVTLIKDDPLLDNIREEPDFQKIVKELELKFNLEHKRVNTWLTEKKLIT